MIATIVLMTVLDAVHPLALASAMSSALRAGDESKRMLLGFAVGMTAILVVRQRVALWLVGRVTGPARSRPGVPVSDQ